MMMFLEFREKIRSIYQRFQVYIKPILKFIMAFIVFQLINEAIGYDTRLTKFVVILGLSAVSAITPSSILVLLSGIVSILHVYKASMMLSILIVLIWLIVYCLFIRFTPKQGYILLAVPILYLLKIPYVVPLVVGLFATPISIVPTSCGVLFYYLLQIVKGSDDLQVKLTIEDALSFYTQVIDTIVKNKQMVLTMVIYAIIIIVVYVIRRLKIDYAREISIASGSIACIIGFLICDLTLNISDQIGSMILGTIISALIAIVVSWFYVTLDYTAVENVQFEDEDYYYYVKAVPKITVTAPEKNVKKFNTQNSNAILSKMGVNTSVDDDDEDDYDEEEDEN